MVRHNALKGLYELERTIGCGGFAKVKLATHLATGEKVAIKIMEKSKLGDDLPRVTLELVALKSMDHPNICKLYQVIETSTHFFLVMEYCSGGELFDHIVEKNRLKEMESRMFFRQIVSAVAYLHSLGYAHRDLKPENVLLDKHQNLKLIDFGLCALPEGGIQNPLFTSCGSPTYAAPELVLGKEYLGPEVDVWAMGVLLYALLAGSLPFFDENIDSLYKKILSGKYQEPNFMSLESKRLIRSMLQVDPKKRITVKELLSHPWLTLGILEPVKYKSPKVKVYDNECVNVMAKHFHLNAEDLLSDLEKWKYDYYTATYLLLLSKKSRGGSLRLYSVGETQEGFMNILSKRPSPLRCVTCSSTPDSTNGDNDLESQEEPPKSILLTRKPDFNTDKPQQTLLSPAQFVEPRKPYNPIRKPLKRNRSPTLDENSPVPAKKAVPAEKSTPSTPQSQTKAGGGGETPNSARRVLGSIERSFHRVRHVLTPRKNGQEGAAQPTMLTGKDLCNVSTTQYHNPEHVVVELCKALEAKGIKCTRKGFTLRGKMEPTAGLGTCSFELEICLLPSLHKQETPTKSILKNGLKDEGRFEAPFVGIRRKRLKGDSWCYKRVCEQILAFTSKEFRTMAESAV